MQNSRPIFLDYQSTTPVDARVLDAMLPYFTHEFGNPHSVEHVFGVNAEDGVALAKQQIADVIGASATDVVLTSGATESNNLALRGLSSKRKKTHIISCVTEHSSVLQVLALLERDGCRITWLPVGPNGLVDISVLEAAINPDTFLVSIMAVNSEIGVIQPIRDIGYLCRAHDIIFHTDAAQAYGKTDLSVVSDCVDLMSFSAHKIYGPKGIGALYISPNVRHRIRPLIVGGDQQQGLRAGTIPVPLAVGFGIAAQLMLMDSQADYTHLQVLRQQFLEGLNQALSGVHINGCMQDRIPGNLNIRIDGVEAYSLLLSTPSIALSTGSACSAGALGPSAVLMALGLTADQAAQSFRIGFGRMTTQREVDTAVELIVTAAKRLRGN